MMSVIKEVDHQDSCALPMTSILVEDTSDEEKVLLDGTMVVSKTTPPSPIKPLSSTPQPNIPTPQTILTTTFTIQQPQPLTIIPP